MTEPRTPTLCIPVESRTNVQAKAIEIILERRLLIHSVTPRSVVAECRGSDANYSLGWNGQRWFCSCGNRGKNPCSHLRALHHVVVKPEN